jgi:hypothetical protein
VRRHPMPAPTAAAISHPPRVIVRMIV